MSFQSTTRSPILVSDDEGYIIKSRLVFPSPYEPCLLNYLYNVPQGYYDELYIFLERGTALGANPANAELSKFTWHTALQHCGLRSLVQTGGI